VKKQRMHANNKEVHGYHTTEHDYDPTCDEEPIESICIPAEETTQESCCVKGTPNFGVAEQVQEELRNWAAQGGNSKNSKDLKDVSHSIALFATESLQKQVEDLQIKNNTLERGAEVRQKLIAKRIQDKKDAEAERDHLRRDNHHIEQRIASLFPDEFPRYADDPDNFPDTNGDDRFIGEHTTESLVAYLCHRYELSQAGSDEVCAALAQTGDELDQLREKVETVREAIEAMMHDETYLRQHSTEFGGGWRLACTDILNIFLTSRETRPSDPKIEAIAEQVHNRWIETKQSQGITSRKSETGEELMVPYAQLSEAAKDLDRNSVRAVLEAEEFLNSQDKGQ